MRPAPEGYVWVKSVIEAKRCILNNDQYVAQPNHHYSWDVELIDIDQDAGDYVKDGGNYIKLLDWLEETGRKYHIRIHSMNPVGVENMRRIIKRNGWTEVR